MFVIFLRGVNLGARNKVPQKPLAERLAAELGVPVQHYLQSGNLVVRGGERDGLASLAGRAIAEDTGLDIPAVVRSGSELAQLVAADPWPDADPLTVHLAMWDGAHDPQAAAALAAADWNGDEVFFTGSNAWLRFAGQSHSSRLSVPTLDRRLRVTATARNARTIRAVCELAAE